MKKQFQILAATLITVAFISCSKEKVEIPETPAATNEEISTSSSSNRPYAAPMTKDLEGWFDFNNNLKDQTRKLADGVPTTRGVIYTKDRKGNLKSAIYLDSTYGIKLKKVPQQTNTSLSVWVKPASLSYPTFSFIIGTSTYGPVATQVAYIMTGGVIMNVTTLGGEPQHLYNMDWRHLVITYDGLDIRVYVDGQFQSSNHQTGNIPTSLADYFLGCTPGKPFWKGAIDDLRFYSTTLSAADALKLYNE